MESEISKADTIKSLDDKSSAESPPYLPPSLTVYPLTETAGGIVGLDESDNMGFMS